MASYRELKTEWSMISQDSTEWTEEDLQLAAELGKTLLERNKELESALRQYQNVIDDQTQEIEYLSKQNTALREVNKSRIQIYEKLEVSIQDLERDNHRLTLENTDQRRRVKALTATVEGLEARCEELQATVDDLRLQLEMPKRKVRGECQTSQGTNVGRLRSVDSAEAGVPEELPGSPESACVAREDKTECTSTSKPAGSPTNKTDCSAQGQKLSPKESKGQSTTEQGKDKEERLVDEEEEVDSSMEQIAALLAQLRDGRVQICRSERRIAELEEQLATMVHQNQALENQVMQLHRDEESKSMHYELSHLDEVRQGQMCSRCLRKIDQNSSNVTEAEEDDSSFLEDLTNNIEHHSSFSLEVQDPQPNPSNPYKELVEKYEALLKVHKQPAGLSLQEELGGQISEGGHLKTPPISSQQQKHRSRTTPTDFSEAETSSSGFSEETSNKGTQTEGRPGSFLCTIADGEDCKFSIYDDASSIDTRFRCKPEYQKLFKEIFGVLKKAAENKEEGEQLPLLQDDHTGVGMIPLKVPPVTPSTDQLPEFPPLDEDSQSILSSTMSEFSFTQQEMAASSATHVIENIVQSQNQPVPEAEDDTQERPNITCSAAPSNPNLALSEPQTAPSEEKVLRPLVRAPPLEYVSVEVRKRNSSRRRGKFSSTSAAERSDSPVTHIIGSPKISYTSRPTSGRRRHRDHHRVQQQLQQQAPQPPTQPEGEVAPILWNGNTLQFWSSQRRLADSPTPSENSLRGQPTGPQCFEYKPSSASQNLHKLKKLDLSYAEVLRNADNKKRQMAKQRHHQRNK